MQKISKLRIKIQKFYQVKCGGSISFTAAHQETRSVTKGSVEQVCKTWAEFANSYERETEYSWWYDGECR